MPPYSSQNAKLQVNGVCSHAIKDALSVCAKHYAKF